MQPSREREFEETVIARLKAEGRDFDPDAMVALFTLARVSNLVSADFDATVWRPSGVTYAGFRVIFTIWVAGPLEPRRLAELASVSRASVSSVVNTLERDGFVVRTRKSADRRLVTIELTDKARELWARTAPVQSERERRWMSSLTSEEGAQLVALLQKLAFGGPASED
jgi:DNA-binding MarR family transcriptional regulator